MTINRVVGAIYRDAANVGLGTTLATFPLHVHTPDGTPGGVLLQNAASLAVQSSTTSANAWGLGLAPGTTTLGVAYGALSNQVQASNIKLAVSASGNVGVGTTTPAYALDVAGNVNFTGSIYQNGVAYGGGGGGGGGASSWTDGAGKVYSFSNVGIGTTAPRSALDVAGTVRATSYIGDGSNITGISPSNYAVFNWTTTSQAPSLVVTGGSLTYSTQQGIQRIADNKVEYGVSLAATVVTPATAGTETYLTLPYAVDTTLYTSSSNVIGELWAEVITPTTDLYFKAVARATPVNSSYAAIRLLSGTSEIPLSEMGTGAVLKLMGTLEYATTTSNILGSSYSNMNVYVNSSISASNITVGGNLGIGAVVPIQPLHVQGSAYLSTNVGIGTTVPRAPLDVLGTVLTTSLGIGTTIPRRALDVIGDLIGSTNVGIGTTLPIQSLHVQGMVYLPTNVGIGTTFPRALLDVPGTVLSTNLGIGTTLPRSALDVMGDIIMTANIGIGTTIPLFPLHVQGITYIDANVGIGTTAPAEGLHVGGYQDAYVEGAVRSAQMLPAYMHPSLNKMFCMPGGTASNSLDVSLGGNASAKGFLGGFTDGRYAYLVPYNNGAFHGILTRVDLQNWSTSGVSYLDVSAAGNNNAEGFFGGFTDGRYGYLIPYNGGASGLFTRVDLQNFTTSGVSYVFMDSGFPTLQNGQAWDRTYTVAGQTVTQKGSGSSLGSHPAVISSIGALWMWGNNQFGQVGIGTTASPQTMPMNISTYGSLSGHTVVSVACGYQHTLALDSTGAAHAWGANGNGQLGIGTTSLVNPIPLNLSTFGSLSGCTLVAVGCGTYYTIVLDSRGALHMWGDNSQGQLGNGTQIQSTTPQNISTYGSLSGCTVVAMACGDGHTAALDNTGALHAWGYNIYGQLGRGNIITPQITPINVSTYGSLSGRRIVAVACGFYHTIALDSTGAVHAWGRNDYGQIGIGTTASPQTTPINISTYGSLSGRTINAVCCDGYHTIVLDSTGAVHTWGQNTAGQLGNGTTASPQTTPQNISTYGSFSGRKIVAVGAGQGYSIGLDSTGLVHMWGNNLNGELGQGTTSTAQTTPIIVPQQFAGLAGGFSGGFTDGSYAYLAGYDGTVARVDLNNFSTSGVSYLDVAGATIPRDTSGFPALFTGQPYARTYTVAGQTVTARGSGNAAGPRTMVVGSSGILWAWGANTSGELGNGTFTLSTSPLNISVYGSLNGHMVVAVASGNSHTIALDSTGAVHAWGANGNGELGAGIASTSDQTTPLNISAFGSLFGSTMVAVACGANHTVALDSTGAVHAWGYNGHGQLGRGNTMTPQTTPINVSTFGSLSGRTIVAVACGEGHTVALDSTGVVHAWGYNLYGQLGRGNTTTPQSTPINVSTFGSLSGCTVVAVAGGGNHTVVLDSTGVLHAWGQNLYGQLGRGNTTTPQTTPINVSTFGSLSGRTVVAVACGASYTLALDSTGVLHAWGQNNQGQLGRGNTTTPQTTPLNISTYGSLSGRTVVALACGNAHTIALDSTGAVHAWGYNFYGQLGRGDTTTPQTTPILVSQSFLGDSPNIKTFVGAFTDGQYGYFVPNQTGLATYHGTLARVNLANFTTAGVSYLDVTTAGNTSARGFCGGFTDGRYGYLVPSLNATANYHGILTRVDLQNFAISGVTTLDISTGNTSAVGFAGGFTDGRYGYLSSKITGTLTRVDLINFVTSGVSYLDMTGADSTYNTFPSMNNLFTGQARSRTYTVAGVTVTRRGSGSIYNTHTMVLTSTGVLWAWGFNNQGQLGIGYISIFNQLTPLNISSYGSLSGRTVVAVACGTNHTVALDGTGAVHAWGYNFYGQLGRGDTTTPQTTPINISSFGSLSGRTVVAVACGYYHTVALDSTGAAHAWGQNEFGQLGRGDFTSPQTTPINISTFGSLSGRTVVAVACGDAHTVALDNTGAVHACGYNYDGELGNGTTITSPPYGLSSPINISTSGSLSGRTIHAVSCGGYHTVALDSTGVVHTWGDNSYNQLGRGNTTTPQTTPINVGSFGSLSGRTINALACGTYHTVALDSTGVAHAWGDNSYGQLGRGDTINSSTSTPINVSTVGSLSGKTISVVACGASHTIALDSTGAAHAWGQNTYGQLGNGTTTDSSTPIVLPQTFLVGTNTTGQGFMGAFTDGRYAYMVPHANYANSGRNETVLYQGYQGYITRALVSDMYPQGL